MLDDTFVCVFISKRAQSRRNPVCSTSPPSVRSKNSPKSCSEEVCILTSYSHPARRASEAGKSNAAGCSVGSDVGGDGGGGGDSSL